MAPVEPLLYGAGRVEFEVDVDREDVLGRRRILRIVRLDACEREKEGDDGDTNDPIAAPTITPCRSGVLAESWNRGPVIEHRWMHPI